MNNFRAMPRPGDKVMVPVAALPVALGHTDALRVVDGWYFATITAVSSRKGGGVNVYFRAFEKQKTGVCQASEILEGWPHHPKRR